MKSFIEWCDTKHTHDHDTIAQMAEIFEQLEEMENCIESLLSKLTKDQGPVKKAYDRFKTASDVLQATLKTCIEKDEENPERGDMPPKSIEVS
jgi:hypothetical protein